MFNHDHFGAALPDTGNKLIRRDFLKTISLSGISLAFASPVAGGIKHTLSETSELSGVYFTLLFDSRRGVFSVRRKDGTWLLQSATVRVNSMAGKRSVVSGNYLHRAKTVKFSDQLGAGQMLQVISEDLEHKIDIEWRISLYDQMEAVFIEAICHNASSRDYPIYSLEPVYAAGENGGRLFMPGVSTCLTNGAMYYDPGTIHSFGTEFVNPEPYGETKGGKISNVSISGLSETVRTWWNAGFFSGYDKEGLVLGYVENRTSLGSPSSPVQSPTRYRSLPNRFLLTD